MEACACNSSVQSVCFRMPETTDQELTEHTVLRSASRIETAPTISGPENPLPRGVCFIAEERHRQLPDWAHFYVTLGSFLSCNEDAGSRVVVGLALPVRTFSAVFCALGLIRSLALKRQENVDQAATHFEYLLSLPVDTPVTYRKGRTRYRGKLKPRPRQRELGIQVENERGGNTTIIITSPKAALRISPLDVEEIRLPMNQQGRQIRTATSFIEAFVPGGDAAAYLSRSSLDTLIVGRINLLKREICDTRFALDKATGSLQDVLRVRRFLGSGEMYRSEICTSAGNRAPTFPGEMVPHTVIFDGARGFLKWQSDMQDSHRVVMLDRSDPEFDDAVNLLMQQSMSRLGDVDLSALPKPPAGVELIAYRTRTR